MDGSASDYKKGHSEYKETRHVFIEDCAGFFILN